MFFSSYQEELIIKSLIFPNILFNETIEEINKSIIIDITKTVKPQYINTVKSIYITNDENFGNGEYLGMNRNGKIKIIYRNPEEFKTVLCHEILHNIIINEEFTEDISYYDICYK